jgi:valyl-tRNA synthetase
MKKKEKITTYKTNNTISKLEEPMPVYRSIKALPQVKDFTFSEFKKIADKSPFTQSEWASILHVSDVLYSAMQKAMAALHPLMPSVHYK